MKGILVLCQLASHGRQLISAHPSTIETDLFEAPDRFDRYEFISLLLPKKEAQWNKLLDLTVDRFRILALPSYSSVQTSVYMPQQRISQKGDDPFRQSESIKPDESEGHKKDGKSKTFELKLSTLAFIIESDPQSSESWKQYESQFYESVLTKLTAALAYEQRLSGYLSLIFQNLIVQRRKTTLCSEDMKMQEIPNQKFIEQAKLFLENMEKVYLSLSA